MLAHTLIFGDAFDKTVMQILNTALQTGTKEAYQEGRLKLRGLVALIVNMSNDGTYATALILLQNAIAKLFVMEDKLCSFRR